MQLNRAGRTWVSMRGRDEGAVATLVAVLLAGGVLLGLAAVTVDVGLIYAERRELQNGADAAALGVALDCASLPCDVTPGGRAGQLADANAQDAASRVTTVCGAGGGTGACPTNTGPPLTHCLGTVPSSATGWVEVRTATETAGGATLLPPQFARALAGNGAYAGTEVAACARAAWGPPGGAAVFPVTISSCEYRAYATSGLAPAPPYSSSGYPSTYEHKIYLHETRGAAPCSPGPPGADFPGGFGFLDPSGGQCSATVSATQTVVTSTGNALPNVCKAPLTAALGSTIYLPIYVNLTGTGASGTYTLDGFAAFFLSGYRIPSASPVSRPSIATNASCTGSETCLIGWFTSGVMPVGTIGTGGTPRGVSVISLVG